MSKKETQEKRAKYRCSCSEEECYKYAGVCIATDSKEKGKWVLESGCTFHICPFKCYFTDFHDFNGGRVMKQNNFMYKILGIGNINLKLHDDTIRKLKQARYVLNLKRNLISLGMLDQMGCSVRIESGVMKIVKGTMVIMKGNRKNGMFILDEDIVNGEVGIASNVVIDKTKLWHLRLGHISKWVLGTRKAKCI